MSDEEQVANLEELRKHVVRETGLRASQVFTDAMARLLAIHRPRAMSYLLALLCFSADTVRREYAPLILNAIHPREGDFQ